MSMREVNICGDEMTITESGIKKLKVNLETRQVVSGDLWTICHFETLEFDYSVADMYVGQVYIGSLPRLRSSECEQLKRLAEAKGLLHTPA
ncbi:hypothetical protein [Pseudoalteromonas rubra]|uniref:hypothetical protein n=1 Tax=Pseudoalteromonas rubra TaxID=43658 RepID=UPI002DBF5CF0|nr:hypothetical protein [Pseudoalteromonas rubra]MEC4091138.1 hypothetical protein [Pseudoalteromonas rubra]